MKLHTRQGRHREGAQAWLGPWLGLGALTTAAAWLVLTAGSAESAYPQPLRTAHAAVAADHPQASAVGVEILRRGGNAVDAACATAFALGVVNPQASGLGGGGFAIIYTGNQASALDFRETAPAAATRDMYLDPTTHKADPNRSTTGALAVAVPGELAGCAEAIAKHGKLTLRQDLEPARRLAAKGFLVGPALARTIADPELLPGAPANPADLDLLLRPGGKPYLEGDRMKRPELARTLAALQKGGTKVFYQGAIAHEIAATIAAGGGILTLADLAAYHTETRTPVEGSYRGHRVLSMPPASSGGIAVVETLGIVEATGKDLAALGPGSSAYLHLLGEAFKHAFADRARHLGDPAFVTVPARLTTPAYAATLAKRIGERPLKDLEQYGSPIGSAQVAPPVDHGTTHISVVDADGNAVALTTTVNLAFGARLLAGKTGILLNDEMDDFSAEPGAPNAFGLVGSAANAIAAGKRPLSSMSPTLVLSQAGQVELVLGGSGGPTIITGVVQTIINVIDFHMDAEAAVSAPRLHAQWRPDELVLEGEHPVDVRQNLEKRGHKLGAPRPRGVVQLVRRLDSGGLESASDPRKFGAPAGY